MKPIIFNYCGHYLFFLLVVSFFSCSKAPVAPLQPEEITLNTDQKNRLLEVFKTTPLTICVKDEVNKRYVDFDCENRTISVRYKNWSFANPSPNTIYAQGGGLVIYVSSSSFSLGSNSPSSTVKAGNTTLNVQTMCLAIDASAWAGMFSAQTGILPIDGISIVMGLDADFSLLSNANSSSGFANYFHGLAYYLVYDFQASGPYDVIDWTNINNQWLGLDGFAMVFSFQQNNLGSFYLSQDGTITVNGGDMTFSGNYWGMEDFSFLDITQNLTFSTFPGSGTMGCN